MENALIVIGGIVAANSLLHFGALLQVRELKGKLCQFIAGHDKSMAEHSKRINRLEEHHME